MKARAIIRCIHSLGVLLFAAPLLSLAGCGGEQPTAVFDATVLLERYEQDRHRHDPHAYSEVDLGEFTVTWREQPKEVDRGKSTDTPRREPSETKSGQSAAPPPEPSKAAPGTSAAAPPPELASLIIRFHLYGVVADGHLEEFSKLLETRGERVRSQVREAVQSSEREQLDDPTLGWLKSELIQSINQSLQAPILRDAVFGDFALERG
jgi:hypothetical protein